MRIGVLGYRGEYGCERLLEASKLFGDPLHVSPDSLNFDSDKGLETPEVDLLVVRDLGGETLEERAFRMDLLYLIGEHIPVFNSPEAINTAGNKFLTYFRLLKKGIPVPRTILGRDILLPFEALKKPIFGYQGKGIELYKKGDLLRGFHMVQEFLRGTEYRVFVIGDELFGAVRKIPREGEWRGNLSLGARVEKVEPDDELVEVAFRASKEIGCLFSAVDLMVASRIYVLEVNATPNFRSFPGAEVEIMKACVSRVI